MPKRKKNLIRSSAVLIAALLLMCGCAAPEPVAVSIPVCTPSPAPVFTLEPTPAPTPTPPPTLAERAAVLIDEPMTRLINYYRRIPEDYCSEDMVEIEALDTMGVLEYSEHGLTGDREAALAFIAMITAANYDGVDGFLLKSVYRTYSEQQKLWDKKIAEDPDYGADGEPVVTAFPGASEHQTGLAFDVSSVEHRKLNSAFGETVQGKWLYEHCFEFGFIVRYPKGTEHLTGILYEPWHFRYVGTELALHLTQNGLTMEEFYSAVTQG